MKVMKKHDRSNNYFAVPTKKVGIMLHFTAGMMPGSEVHLATNPSKINVPYIVCLDGTINEYFEPQFWAYHTGKGAAMCKKYIGIEIENWGGLTLKNGLYLPWTGSTKQAVHEDMVVKLKKFRGYEYYSRMSKKQREAVISLIKDLQAAFPNAKELITHADVNTGKNDWPPDHPDILEIYNRIAHDKYSF